MFCHPCGNSSRSASSVSLITFLLLPPRKSFHVVMNSVINGNLGTEESVSDNPFKKGQPFEMFTVIKSEGYKVYVNGKELCTFKHRIPLEKVSTLNISGDVAVTLSVFNVTFDQLNASLLNKSIA
uniref:Galectin n=1 Tax=Sinocyclocheilus rhinocerous TaxID=307959 RepID=A0A673IPM3_9TELE